ncbi:MAG: hypothetical protein M3R38_37715 [Actinomycetota bacterium]|nr:hypothetical protein [Actinomycetota bacterium]
MSRDVRHLRDLHTGTVVLLPEELGRLAGYAEGQGSTEVLVPGHKILEAVSLPPLALVEVVAYPQELAHAYLKGDLARVDRRWRSSRSKKKGRPAAGAATAAPDDGDGPLEGDAA